MAEAFIDESLSMEPSGDDYFIAIASVITTNRRHLELSMRRLRRILKLKARAELKAWSSPPQITRKVLQAIADDPDIAIVVAIWSGARKDGENLDRAYQRVIARCALQTVRLHKRIDLLVDKRYTNSRQQRRLESAVREVLATVSGNVVRIFQVDSQTMPEMIAPDFVAWAVMQYHRHHNSEFYKIIRPKIAHFDNLSAKRKAAHPRHR